MDIVKYSIENKAITWLTIIVFMVLGVFSFFKLGRLEDPDFTIKTALVYTVYPGANAYEVEQEVTDKVETSIQRLPYIDEITSKSYPGISEIQVDIKPKYMSGDLPQIWDELRRKVHDVQSSLPEGAQTSIVNDDFGDVFGIFYAITGEGFSYRELKEYAKEIRKEFLLIDDVAKVSLVGDRQENIFIDISRSKMFRFGVSSDSLRKVLSGYNLLRPSGGVKVVDEYIRITPTGEFKNIEDIGEVLVNRDNSGNLVYLKDIANIYKGYKEIPNHIIRHNGKHAITLGVSLAEGGNIIDLGKAITSKLKEVSKNIPAGVEVHPIYYQPEYVDKSINNFVISLVEAVLIVIVILLFAMGLSSGLIIGAILLLTIFATFFIMSIFDINLQRISLGALIIALGMLVDNAIVIVEGVLGGVKAGNTPIKAAIDIVQKTIWPLLGATIVAILAFAPIGLSDDTTGEFCASLFYVILISLMLSWYFAISVTPLLCVSFLKQNNADSSKKNLNKKTKSCKGHDPYGSPFFIMYKKFLVLCIKRKKTTVIIMISALFLSIFGFQFVKQSFFPNSSTPMFYFDYWREQGTDIRVLERDVKEIEKYILSLDEVVSVTSFLGQGASRFTLTYEPERTNSSYSQFIVKVKRSEDVKVIAEKLSKYVHKNFSNSENKIIYMRLGPGDNAKIEARIIGEDPKILHDISAKVEDIFRNTENTINIKDNWRQMVKVLNPIYMDIQANRVGISRSLLMDYLEMNFSGSKAGTYRDGDEFIPIILRSPDIERLNVETIRDIRIWSPIIKEAIPINQIVKNFKINWEYQIVHRKNRKRAITVQADPNDKITSDELFMKIRSKVESLDLPRGYYIEWGGEYESSTDAKEGLNSQLPKGLFSMVLIVILLFGRFKQPIIIWLTVPLGIIGVTLGLLITNEAFGFMALLGLLSLSGMLIKNSIVLIEEIDHQIKGGKDPYNAVIDSAVSRVRPVSMAAVTTVLGMIPLLPDIFFSSLAVTIMGGLTFATVLTLVFVPVLYIIIFKIPCDSKNIKN